MSFKFNFWNWRHWIMTPNYFRAFAYHISALPPSSADWMHMWLPPSQRGFRLLIASLAFSGFDHHGSLVHLVNFTLHLRLLGARNNCQEDQLAEVTKDREGKRTEDQRWEGKTLGQAQTGVVGACYGKQERGNFDRMIGDLSSWPRLQLSSVQSQQCALKELPDIFFGDSRKLAGSHLFALLLGYCLLSMALWSSCLL